MGQTLAGPFAGDIGTRATPEMIVWDPFTGAFDAGPDGRWFHVTAGDFVTDDGVVATSADGGLHIAAAGVNPLSRHPAFRSTLAQESANGGIPATNDHAKWLAYMNHLSSAGFPGFDAVDGSELRGAARIGGRTFGTKAHPFGAAVADPDADVRLAAFAMTTIDIETWMVFDFMFTNRRVYALYERLPFGRSRSTNYAAFTYVIPVATRTPMSVHDASIAYDRAKGIVRWRLDDVEVFAVTRIGHRLASRSHLVIDLGGVEESVAPRQLDYGMGLFTLLDGADGDGPGLVRLSDRLPYFSPGAQDRAPLSFVDECSRPESRLFGQGAEMHVGAYSVGLVDQQ